MRESAETGTDADERPVETDEEEERIHTHPYPGTGLTQIPAEFDYTQDTGNPDKIIRDHYPTVELD